MRRLALLVYLCTLPAACGGGNGSNASNLTDPSASGPVATANPAPVADAGPDQNVVINQTVTLNGSSSHDAAGEALGYEWSFASKPAGSISTLSDATAANPTFTPDVVGYYSLDLRVNNGKTTSSSVQVMIVAFPDFRQWFSTTQSAVKSNTDNYSQPGSTFKSTVTNISYTLFSLDRYEFVNCRGIVASTTDPLILNGNRLQSGVSISITATLTAPRLDSGFKSIYYFTDPATGRKYIATTIY